MASHQPLDSSETIKVPLELLNRVFRQHQKRLEKEVEVLVRAVAEYTKGKKVDQTQMTAEEARKKLKMIRDRLKGTKKKLEEAHLEQHALLNALQHRSEFLLRARDVDATQESGRTWTSQNVDRMLADWLLRNGFYEIALALAEKSGITELIDASVFDSSKTVISGLLQHDTSAALQWCSDNKSKLAKIDSVLEFELRLQEVIEYIRKGETASAMSHSRKYLTEFPPSKREMVDKAMTAMVIFGSKMERHGEYQRLFSPNRWNDLVEIFQKDNYVLHSLTPHAVVDVVLGAGLAVMKTPYCYDSTQQNTQCPVCNAHLSTASQSLPFSHHEHSTLVCKLSGDIMDDENPPMVLPNDNVYSRRAMEESAAQNDGEVVCIRSGKKFPFSDIKKAYIMQ